MSRTTRQFAQAHCEPLEARAMLAATKVMPLGDSITEAQTGHASYRYWLWNQLQTNGFTNVDFVGSMTGVLGGPPQFPNFDQNHEGHWGWRADQVLANIGGWANTHRPDVVIMHLGSNDMFQGQSVSSTITELGSIIDTIRSASPNVTVLLAQVIPANQNLSQLQQLNAQIPALVSAKNTTQSRVVLVDQYTGFSASTDTYDGIHPNQAGEQKMSAKWYTAVTPFLPPAPPPPSGTYLSDLNPTFAANGWGPYERDRSNGEQGAGDGNIITLNGTTYSKGLGVHASSELRYSLAGGSYGSFLAEIGVDDEVGSAGSVVFQVWDNSGVKLYDSGTMTGTTVTKSVNISVVGKSEIRLIVTDGGNTNDSDHGDWALARLTPAPAPAPVVNAFNGATINEGATYTAVGSFTDAGPGPWTATVNYGDGAGDVPLPLNPDKTFALSHLYADNGSYTVTVNVTGPGGTGSRTATVTSNNVGPTVFAGGNATSGVSFTRAGFFTDPGADTWTATVDYGAGAGFVPLALNPNKTFNLSNVYAYNGTYSVRVTIIDDDGATSTSQFLVTITGGKGGVGKKAIVS